MKYLLSSAFLSFIFISCLSQSKALPNRITQTSVVIYNDSNNRLTVLLGDPSTKMDTIILMENDVWTSPPLSFDPIIKIQTKKHIGEYQLSLGKYYMIYWNDKKKYWDIIKTNKRD
jgi:hypothetical protein